MEAGVKPAAAGSHPAMESSLRHGCLSSLCDAELLSELKLPGRALEGTFELRCLWKNILNYVSPSGGWSRREQSLLAGNPRPSFLTH